MEHVTTAPPLREHRVRRRIWEVLGDAQGKQGDVLNTVVDASIIVLIVLSVACVVLDSVETVHAAVGTQIEQFELFCLAVFSIEYLLRLWSCVEADNYRGRLRFALAPLSVIDLIAIAPGLLAPFAGTSGNSVILRLMRLARVARVLKIGRYSKAMSRLIQAVTRSLPELAVAYALTFGTMLIMATVMYSVEHGARTDGHFSSIPNSMWWAVVTLTTIGYGDVFPITELGKVLTGGFLLTGIAIVAWPISILTTSLAEVRKEELDSAAPIWNCSKCAAAHAGDKGNFCPNCGAPQSALAVEVSAARTTASAAAADTEANA